MTEGTTEHLPVNLGQEYRVKLGMSFTFPAENAFHALKYDFKPQSVDPTRPGTLEITEEKAVNVSLPVGQGESGDDYAQFRGPMKNCTKECILIIDRVTGEAILERISDTVQLKATRDSHKPIHRDRSVSPSPFLSQPKAPPPKASFTKPSPAPQSNPTKKQHSAASTHKKSKSLGIGAPRSSDFGGKNLAGKPGASKRQPKIVKANSLPKIPTGYNLLNPKSGGTDFGGQESSPLTQDISPLRSSTNPTPEPGALPPKRAKVSLSSSSSCGSISSSSDSDSVEAALTPHDAPVMSQREPIPVVQSIPASLADTAKDGSYAQTQKPSSMNPSSLHPPHTLGPFSRSSSAGQPTRPLSRTGMLAFVDEASAQLLKRSPSRHEMKLQSGGPQPVVTQGPFLTQRSVRDNQPVVPSGGGQTVAATSSSSSSSGSDSSSGSSSSDSSSDSDEEIDMEVAHAFSNPPPARQMSMSVLRSDLNLSESGSDSDL